MTDKNFAISFAPGQEGQAVAAWAGWVHAGEIENGGSIAQGSVEDAFASMVQQLSQGDAVKNIWVYSHGDQDGFLHAPKTSGQSPSMFDEKTAQGFINNSTAAPKFHKFCTPDTTIHAYACNAGKADALASVRLLFNGGSSGTACGPNGWFHLHLARLKPFETRVKPDSGSGCALEHFVVNPTSSGELDKAVDDFANDLAAKPECFAATSQKRAKKDVAAVARKTYEDYFLDWFKLLDKAALVPEHIRGASPKKHRAAILAEMWALWGANWPTMDGEDTWLAMPFIAPVLLFWPDIKGHTRKWVQKRKKGIYPYDKKWKKTFKHIPKKAKVVC